jgi:iron(II)-dependent oxidoreductase
MKNQKTHFVDIFNHRELTPIRQAGRQYISVDTQPFDKAFLGTNNEGAVGAIAQLSEHLSFDFQGNTLRVSASVGRKIQLWKGNPSYEAKPLATFGTGNHTYSLDKLGEYEGKFVIQLFDKDDELLDEKVVEIVPGQPRLISHLEKTVARKGKASPSPSDQILISAGRYSHITTHGDVFLPYPKVGYCYAKNRSILDGQKLDFQR